MNREISKCEIEYGLPIEELIEDFMMIGTISKLGIKTKLGQNHAL